MMYDLEMAALKNKTGDRTAGGRVEHAKILYRAAKREEKKKIPACSKGGHAKVWCD